ncbi:hypothetical protein QTP88_013907 [Uroleucon formosanum]
MKDEEKAISKIYDKIVPMETLNAEQLNKHYNKSDKCHICERYLLELPPILEKKFKIIKGVIEYYKQFKIVEDDDVKKLKLYEDKLKNEIENKNKNMQKVRDHDHLTGEYRGAAHSICYDAHLFIKEFGNDDKQIKLIPNNEEKYISFSKMMPRVVTRKGKGKDKKDKEIVIFTELRFIDSFKFLPSSLDKLTNNLRNDSKLNLRNKFKELSTFFPKEHLELVTRKLAYPYEYMDCEEKFNETCLPPIEKLDISLKNYKLDPLWYYTTPGFAWDCMLRMTKVKLDLLTDIDQILMIESGIRGGLSQCSQRYSKANNKYMGDKFKKRRNQYFYNTWMQIIFMEVDLSYPKELHDLHSDFPLAPERHFDNKQLPKLLTTLVLEFNQSPWLKVYIDFNTNLRSEAKNEFEKEYFKLMNNSVYGRIMMTVRNHVDIRLFNKKVLGKFKDELNGKIMTEFIGLRSKLYSYRVLDTEKEIKKAKGVKKNVVENKICFNDFQIFLLTKETKYVKQNLFRTKKHDIFTVEQNKKALSVYDDKRFILDNGIDTLAWGHYKTNINRNDFVNHLNTLIRNQNQKD